MKKKDIIKALEPYNDEDTVVIRDGDNYVVPNRIMSRDDIKSGYSPYVYDEKGEVNIEKIIVIDNDQI